MLSCYSTNTMYLLLKTILCLFPWHQCDSAVFLQCIRTIKTGSESISAMIKCPRHHDAFVHLPVWCWGFLYAKVCSIHYIFHRKASGEDLSVRYHISIHFSVHCDSVLPVTRRDQRSDRTIARDERSLFGHHPDCLSSLFSLQRRCPATILLYGCLPDVSGTKMHV